MRKSIILSDPRGYYGEMKMTRIDDGIYGCECDEAGKEIVLTLRLPRAMGVFDGWVEASLYGGGSCDSFPLEWLGSDGVIDTYTSKLRKGVGALGSAVSIRIVLSCACGSVAVRQDDGIRVSFVSCKSGEVPTIILPPPRNFSILTHGFYGSIVGTSGSIDSKTAGCPGYIMREIACHEAKCAFVPFARSSDEYAKCEAEATAAGVMIFPYDEISSVCAENTRLTEALTDFIDGKDESRLESELRLLESVCPDEAANAILNRVFVRRLDATFSSLLAACVYTLPGIPVFELGEMSALPETDSACRRLGRIRRRSETLRDGDFHLIHLSRELLIFSRSRDGESTVCAVNVSSSAFTLTCRDGITVIYGGRGYKTQQKLAPQSAVVFCIEKWCYDEKYIEVTRDV